MAATDNTLTTPAHPSSSFDNATAGQKNNCTKAEQEQQRRRRLDETRQSPAPELLGSPLVNPRTVENESRRVGSKKRGRCQRTPSIGWTISMSIAPPPVDGSPSKGGTDSTKNAAAAAVAAAASAAAAPGNLPSSDDRHPPAGLVGTLPTSTEQIGHSGHHGDGGGKIVGNPSSSDPASKLVLVPPRVAAPATPDASTSATATSHAPNKGGENRRTTTPLPPLRTKSSPCLASGAGQQRKQQQPTPTTTPQDGEDTKRRDSDQNQNQSGVHRQSGGKETDAEVLSDAVTMIRVNSKGALSLPGILEQVVADGGGGGGIAKELSGGGGSVSSTRAVVAAAPPPSKAQPASSSSSSSNPTHDIHRVNSMPVLKARPPKQPSCPPTGSGGGEEVVIEGGPTASAVTSAHRSAVATDPDAHRNPSDYLRLVLNDAGYPSDPIPASEMPPGYFLEHTPSQIASYDAEVTSAVRSGNVSRLRSMVVNDGRDLQCSNRFGESIVHMACRRGSLDVVRFLLDEAGVSVRVRDDFGRTPLHDACWTTTPAFELVRTILRREPDLLLVSDRRGHTPLGYVRRDDWGKWIRFLDESRELLVPRVLVEPK